MILNKKFTPYIYILFFSFSVNTFYGQVNNNYVLKMISRDSIEDNVIKSINYKSIFTKIKQLNRTKDSVLNLLKDKGYYTLLTDSINQKKKEVHILFKIGFKNKKYIYKDR